MESTTKRTKTYKPKTTKKIATVDRTVKNGDVIGGVSEKRVNTKPMQTTGDTVTVCLNYPRNMKFYVPDKNGNKRAIVFNGNATNLVGKDRGILPIGAYGVTLGVPREAWEWIKTHYQNMELIKKGLLFVSETRDVRREAEERVDLRHGFEPVDPKQKEYKG